MELTVDDGTHEQRSRAPAHLWLVAALTLIWNGFGVVRYLSVHLDLVPGVSAAPAELALFAGFPLAVSGFWALGVWGALAGSALLMLRSKWALQGFVMSLIGLMGVSIYLFAMTGSSQSIYAMPIMLATWLITLASLFYTSRIEGQGVLR